jgi:lysyl-tRNA synthetase class 2
VHQPEFTMIEWYRRGISFDAMIDETCELISTLLQTCGAGSPDVTSRAYAEFFAETIGEHPLDADVAALRRRAAELVPDMTAELEIGLGDDRSGWLDLLMARVAIPGLPRDAMTIVHRYPAAQAALARLDPADPRFALRFEVFSGPLELANGYDELTDAGEQRSRFAADAARRSAAGIRAMDPDWRLLAALEHGLPDCCGVAVGFDRVLMCATGAADIADVTSFTL